MEMIPNAEHSLTKMVHQMHSIAQSERPQGVQIGIITTPPPAIKVKLNNIELTAKDVYLSEYWLQGHTRAAKGHIVSGTQDAQCSLGAPHKHPIDNDYTDSIVYTDTLKIGDLVEVIPVYGQDEQLYIVGHKVVKL